MTYHICTLQLNTLIPWDPWPGLCVEKGIPCSDLKSYCVCRIKLGVESFRIVKVSIMYKIKN